MLNLFWRPVLQLLLVDEILHGLSFNQFEVLAVEPPQDELMDRQQQKEYNARRHCEVTPEAVSDFREISCNAATAHSVAEQEHEVARVSVHLRDVVDFVALRPRLVAFVPLHHS